MSLLPRSSFRATLASLFASTSRDPEAIAEAAEQHRLHSLETPMPFYPRLRVRGRRGDRRALRGQALIDHDNALIARAEAKRERQATFRAIQHAGHHASMAAPF